MLRSVDRAYSTIGYTREQIRSIKLPNPPQILEMAKEVDLEVMYTSYRLESHSTHGDWFDISRRFLQEKDGRFYPRFTEDSVDIRMLNPMQLLVYETLFKFLSSVQGHEVKIEEELVQDVKIIQILEKMHFNYVNKRPLITDLEMT